MAHAKLSPSSAHRWMMCPNSIPLAAMFPVEDTGSVYADEGSVAHHGADVCLSNRINAIELLGRQFEHNGKLWEFTEEMVENVQVYLDYVRSIGGQVFSEQKLPIHTLTGEEGAHGTSDAVVLKGDSIWICDLKFGRGERVEAQDNQQLLIYGLAAVREFELTTEIKHVHLVIIQPRLNHISEWALEIDDLECFAEDLAIATDLVDEAEDYVGINGGLSPDLFNPGEKTCRWCPAKAHCPGIANQIVELFDEYATIEPVTTPVLADLYAKVPMIRDWANAIEARVEQELNAGIDVPGYKLVEGRRGARKWTDPDAAASIMAGVLDRSDLYEQTLISPTTAEKRLKKSTVWGDLQLHITQATGKPTVAANDDPRPAIQSFEDISNG